MRILICGGLAFSACAYAHDTEAPPIKNPAVISWIEHVSHDENIDITLLKSWFAHAHWNPKVIALMNKPYEVLPWYRYRHHLISKNRIHMGIARYHQDKKALNRIAKHYHVDPSIVLAITGIESNYGKAKMPFSTLDALTTLTFQYPRRATFFKSQLKAFMKLCIALKRKPQDIHGSYAGALGIPQFMPSNYLALSVDEDHDGYKNLFSSYIDSYGSIAHYLAIHGWVENGKYFKTLKHLPTNKKAMPSTTLKRLAIDRSSIIAFALNKGTKHIQTYPNFAVISTYNRSPQYVMAVIELADAIKRGL